MRGNSIASETKSTEFDDAWSAKVTEMSEPGYERELELNGQIPRVGLFNDFKY